MTTPAIRAALERLLHDLIEGKVLDGAIANADAALAAEPVGEGPSDEELLAMRSWSSHGHTFDSDLVDFARAVLARWGTPAALAAEPEGEGPTEEDLCDLAEVFNGDPVPAIRRALELWGHPATPPAPETDDGDGAIDRWIESRPDWPNGWLAVTQCQLTALIGEALEHWGRPIAPAALPPDYIDPEHQGDDWELLESFYGACNAEGGSADEIHLRGIRAVLAARPATPPAPEPGEACPGCEGTPAANNSPCAVCGHPPTPPSRDALAAEPVGGEPILQWTENMPPSKDCRYDHCTAETLFGRFLLRQRLRQRLRLHFNCNQKALAPPGLADLAAKLIAESKPMDPEMAEALTPEARWDFYSGPATPPAPEPGEGEES